MPLVSIIVPCYNEQATISLLLDAICAQTVATQDLEVIIADGRSTDCTRSVVAEFQQAHPNLVIQIVDNPKRNIPSALNCALAAARGAYIVRLDAHSMPAPDYVERCLEGLRAGRGENVGGVWEIRPRGDGPIQRAIAIAAAHRLGVGDARYRYTEEASAVDTVPFGAFRRETFDRFGRFDETLLTNEDYEFNARIRKGGATVWLDPRIRSTYFARGSLVELARQYGRYGYWKWRMLRRYPQTLRWRQALPPAFVLGVIVLLAGSLWLAPARFALIGVLAVYTLTLVAGSLPAAWKHRSLSLAGLIPLAIAVMHFSWGAGFLWSVISGLGARTKT
jgi:glycosyltransferase involved in cell wall biosynthesis